MAFQTSSATKFIANEDEKQPVQTRRALGWTTDLAKKAASSVMKIKLKKPKGMPKLKGIL